MKDKISFLIVTFACCILFASSERECMIDQHGALRPDANDCSKYYRCEYRINSKMNNTHEFFWNNEECPPYEYFDWKVSNCIPNYGNCKDALLTPYIRCVTDETQLDPGNGKQYFVCKNGTWNVKNCPPKLYYNETASQCTKLCTTGSIKYDSNDCSNYYVCKNDEEWTLMNCKPEMYFDRKRNLCVNDENNVCKDTRHTTMEPIHTTKASFTPEKCIESQTKPDLQDCGRYFTCVNGKWSLKTCSANQYFDIFFLECRTDYDDHCQKQHQEQNRLTTVASVESTCSHGQLVEDPTDCTAYLVCVNGIYTKKYCNKNMYFNKATLTCVPEDGTCRPTQKPIIRSTTSKVVLKNCEDHDTKPDSTNCERYFECFKDNWVPKLCGFNSHYNSTAKECVFGSCEINPTKKPIKVGEIGCTEGETKSDLFDCVRYYVCKNEKWVPSQCNRNMYYSELKKKCIQNDGTCKEESQMLNKDLSIDNCQEGETKADIFDCTRYYLCRKDAWVKAQCNNKMAYSSTKKHCILNDGSCKDLSQILNKDKSIELCQEGETKADIFDCTRYYLCRKDAWIKAQCNNKMAYSSTKKHCILNDGSCKISQDKNKVSDLLNKKNENCEEGETKRDIFDCSRFYLCKNDIWTAAVCKKKQYYNQIKKYCVTDNGECDKSLKKNLDETDSKQENMEKCKSGDFKEDKNKCNHYYYCRDSVWKSLQCPERYYYNVAQKYCLPNIDNCKVQGIESKESECTEGKFKLDRKVITVYHECINTKWISKNCEEGHTFSMVTLKCVKHASRTEDKKNNEIKKNECIDGEHKPNDDSKMTYYACADGVWKLKSCLNGMIYDPDSTVCLPDMAAKKAAIKT